MVFKVTTPILRDGRASHARDNGWAKGTGWIDGTAGHLVRRPPPEVLGSPICVAKKKGTIP